MNGGAADHDTVAHEFELRDEDFDALRALVKLHTGINLGAEKRALIYARLSRRLRALGLADFRQYRECLENGDGAEIGEFRDAITTNLTSFFREAHHFDYLRASLLLPWMSGGGQRLRIWSAGCSTGEEPYSIAMTVLETLGDPGRWDVRILATDLDSQVLATASRGSYAEDRVRGVAPARLERFFEPAGPGTRSGYAVRPELRDLIAFRQLNLMDELPMKGPLDVVFCRNVIIYFDKDTQRGLLARLARKQVPGALLFLGHSENVVKVTDAYTLVGNTVYRRN